MSTGAPGSADLPVDLLARGGWLPVLLLRHGRTAANADRRLVGSLDVPLDEVGRAQAAAAGRRLSAVPLQAVVTSPLSRARETADLVVAGRAVPVRVDPRLSEWHQGVLEGRAEADLATPAWSALREAWRADPASVEIPEAEPLAACRSRAIEALEAVARSFRPPRPVLVVGHQVVLAAALSALAGRPLSDLRAYTSRNAALHLLGWRDGVWRIEVVDDVAHLAGIDQAEEPARSASAASRSPGIT